MFKEFKDFIMTGNVIDFAVAVILAGAVGLVVNGFVNDIAMPLVGHIAGGMDFSDLKFVLSPESGTAGESGYVAENAVRWGAWVTAIINLIIIGLVLFFIVKAYNKTRAPKPTVEAGPSQEDLLAEIRDLLKK